MSAEAPSASEITELLAHWWYRYDEGRVDELSDLLTADATFRVRTDTGTTDYEAFVRADFTGAEEIVFWQAKHRGRQPASACATWSSTSPSMPVTVTRRTSPRTCS